MTAVIEVTLGCERLDLGEDSLETLRCGNANTLDTWRIDDERAIRHDVHLPVGGRVASATISA